MPNADKATIDDRKFTDIYLMRIVSQVTQKEKLFLNDLDITKTTICPLRAKFKTKYELPGKSQEVQVNTEIHSNKNDFYTPNGKPYNFVAGWLVDGAQTKLTIMIKEVK